MRKMKDSGVEWIGEIPKDWHITQTRSGPMSRFSTS